MICNANILTAIITYNLYQLFHEFCNIITPWNLKLYATSKENNIKLVNHACSKSHEAKPLYFNIGCDS
jgi:hypothetical protein